MKRAPENRRPFGKSDSDDIRFQNLQDMVNILFRMNIQVNGLGKIQRENTHDRLCIDHITAGNKIEVRIEFCKVVDKGFNLIDRIKRNLNCCHVIDLLGQVILSY